MRPLLILNERDTLHPRAGGAEVNLFEVTRRLVERGYGATLLCEGFAGGRADETRSGIEVHRLGRQATYYLQLPAEVRRRLKPETVVIEHLCKLPFLTPLYVRRPVVAITHHLFGRTSFRQVSIPAAAGVLVAERLIPPVYRRAQFIAVSPSTRDDLLRRGINPARLRIIPNGVDCEHYTPSAEKPAQPPTLLALGRVEPYKRLDLVLQAFTLVRRELPDARLGIVGGGTGLSAVRVEIQKQGLAGSVTSTGPVDESDKLQYVRDCHVVLNSSEKEGWGLTALEAAACGRPTIASDVPGLRDAVLHGRTGLLVPHANPRAMADAALALLRDGNRRRELGRQARAWAERFSWDEVAEATAQCIEESCGLAPASARVTWFDEAATPSPV